MNGSPAPEEGTRSGLEAGVEVPENSYHESEVLFSEERSATEMQRAKPRKNQSGEPPPLIRTNSANARLGEVLNDFASSSDVREDPLTGKKLFWGSIYPPRFDEPHVWNLSYRQQSEKLQSFRQHLEQRGVLAPGTVGKPDMPDVHKLLRFLKARKFDIDLATTMFVNSLAWRKAFGTDELLDGFHFHEVDRFIKYWPQGYHKTDKLGRPVYIQQLGQINTRELKKFTNEERILKFHVQEYERLVRRIMPQCSRVQAKNVDQTFAILDIKGVGLASFNQDVRSLLGKITAVDQNNYPEMMGHICIINAPMAFRGIWNLVKPMLDSRTQEKIEVCPADYMPALTKWIDIENIPEFLGGKSQGSLLDDIGAWNDPEILNKADVTSLGC